MQAFFDFCIGYVRRRPRVLTPPPVGPIVFECGNLCCISETRDISTWTSAKVKTRVYYFCKQTCWEVWVSSPPHIIHLSPSVAATDAPEIPHLTLE